MRRAMMFASGGITGWQPCVGIREQVDRACRAACRPAPVSGRIWPVLVAVGRAHFGDQADAADRRHVVADGAARGVERRAEPFFGGLDLEEVVEPDAEALELRREEPGQRIAELSRRSCAGADCAATDDQDRPPRR